MLEWINAFVSLFGDLVTTLFQLPFYGELSFGYLLIGIATLDILLIMLFGRIK